MKIFECTGYTMFKDVFVEGDRQARVMGRDTLITADGREITPIFSHEFTEVYSMPVGGYDVQDSPQGS